MTVQWLELHAFTVLRAQLHRCSRTKMPQEARCGQKMKNNDKPAQIHQEPIVYSILDEVPKQGFETE